MNPGDILPCTYKIAKSREYGALHNTKEDSESDHLLPCCYESGTLLRSAGLGLYTCTYDLP